MRAEWLRGTVFIWRLKLTIKFNLTYSRGNSPVELESRQGDKRASLSFQLGFVCDAQTLSLVGWWIADMIHRYFLN